MNAELQQFVREALARSIPRDAVREQLVRAGWRAEEIDGALAAWAEVDFPVPVPRRRAYLSARETFMYLVLFVTLYVTAVNVGVLLFQFVERWLPDPASTRVPYRGDAFAARTVRDAAAALLVAFPAYLALAAVIGRLLVRDPEKRGSRVRKWLTYLTLFVAALVILGNLTVLVGRLLSGELAPRFLAKTAIVFAIAGVVFGHYLADLRREEDERRERAPGSAWLARAAAASVFVTLLAGLIVAGSPRAARMEEIDRRRVEDLRQISNAVETYYRERRELPAALDSLPRVPTAPGVSLSDPASRLAYEYRIVDSIRYELCATFDRADTLGGGIDPRIEPYSARGFWGHPAGRHCYGLAIPRTLTEASRP